MTGLVLIAEGDPFNLRLLEELCEEAGFDVVTAGDGGSTLSVVARHRPALIVLDSQLVTDDGLEVLEVLKSDPELASIPVLLTTASDDEETRKRGLGLGAADFIARPYRVFEVEQRIKNLLQLVAAERAASRARGEASAPPGDDTDPLTHAGGPVQLRIGLEYEATRAIRYGHALTCLVIRITNFDAIVEQSGEDAGRGAVMQLTVNLRASIRGIDHLFRSDTDELTVLLPETTNEESDPLMERLRSEAARGGLTGVAIEPEPALAFGRATIVPGGDLTDGEALFQRARSALAPL